MNFNTHSDLAGQHAYLSGSKYHWINYSKEKLVDSYKKYSATQRGVVLHDFARQCVELGIKLPRGKQALNQFVNDAIGFRMKPEQVLFYSNNAFGTADAISFRGKYLRIHDLKTGTSPVYITQLKVYAALFCLEYNHLPEDIEIELRIYQGEDIFVEKPDPIEIRAIMDKIIEFDMEIELLKAQED